MSCLPVTLLLREIYPFPCFIQLQLCNFATLFRAGALGALAPCVLHGSTSDRLHPSPSHFRESCSTYLALFCVGNFLTQSNVFAPCYTARTRAAIRRKYHLKVGRNEIKSGVGGLVSTFLSPCATDGLTGFERLPGLRFLAAALLYCPGKCGVVIGGQWREHGSPFCRVEGTGGDGG